MKIDVSEKLKNLPPYLFAEIDKAKEQAIDEGRDVIDLGVGDPDAPTPMHIIEGLYESAKKTILLIPVIHRHSLQNPYI